MYFHNLNDTIAIDEMCFNIDESRSIIAVILTNIQIILIKEQPIHKPYSAKTSKTDHEKQKLRKTVGIPII